MSCCVCICKHSLANVHATSFRSDQIRSVHLYRAALTVPVTYTACDLMQPLHGLHSQAQDCSHSTHILDMNCLKQIPARCCPLYKILKYYNPLLPQVQSILNMNTALSILMISITVTGRHLQHAHDVVLTNNCLCIRWEQWQGSQF